MAALVAGLVVISGCASSDRGPVANRTSIKATATVVAPTAVSLPSPRAIVRGGRSYPVAEIAPIGAVHDTSNPNVIEIVALDAGDGAAPGCVQLSPSVRVISEDSDSVRLATFAYRLPPNPKTATACVYSTDVGQSLFADLAVPLARPLGARRLIDAKSGQVIGILGPAMIRTPSYLPPGYRLRYAPSFDAADPDPIREYARGQDGLMISVGSAAGAARPTGVIGRTEIGGWPRPSAIRSSDAASVGASRLAWPARCAP
jgi:hypothetical protein